MGFEQMTKILTMGTVTKRWDRRRDELIDRLEIEMDGQISEMGSGDVGDIDELAPQQETGEIQF